ncbi:unnamed protein product [Cylicocyclus nassatus]|uniref:G-protein coupled receptors family 1 profile domain-containing protein n=1 Tax=Cylicocyclus nassatus TaxID=53992 RepID=A0AA36GQ61_CYLNA|nr:unnamed protein product [Cylicocyclus nassatus]
MEEISVSFQIFYIVVPLISIIGNSCLVYVTIRSRKLRSACNIFIALIAGSDVLHMFAHYIMLSVYHFSSNQRINRSVCIQLQLLPTFGAGLSSIIIFSVAIDRLMSLQKFYYMLTKTHYTLYIASHLGIAAMLMLAVVSCAWAMRNSDEVICGIADAMHGQLFMLYLTALSIIGLLTLITYVAFLLKVRRMTINRDKKDIYRSLLVTNFFIVFGWLATGSGIVVNDVFNIAIDNFSLGLVIGITGNISIASNFFVYYAISKQYRTSFDHYLRISSIKSALGLTTSTFTTSVITFIK